MNSFSAQILKFGTTLASRPHRFVGSITALQTAAALFFTLACSLLIAPVAHAEIMKCQDTEGRVVYSDVACVDGTPMRSALADTASQKKSTKNGLASEIDRGQMRDSAWANHAVPATKKSLDKLTLRDAHHVLKSSDSALAFLRQQTLASNR